MPLIEKFVDIVMLGYDLRLFTNVVDVTFNLL